LSPYHEETLNEEQLFHQLKMVRQSEEKRNDLMLAAPQKIPLKLTQLFLGQSKE
jgi:hypothetical protein